MRRNRAPLSRRTCRLVGLALVAIAFGRGTPAFAQASFTKVVDFPGTDGYLAYGTPIKGPDGAVYGTTYYGGACGAGTVYRVDQFGVTTQLHAFCGGNTDGAYPAAGLTLGADGNFYGTTVYGSPSNAGTVYKITPTGALTIIHPFAGGSEGSQPASRLIFVGGVLYGTAQYVSGGSGTVFKVNTDGSGFATVHKFADWNGSTYPEGYVPHGGVTLGPDGLLYGTTSYYGGTSTSYNGTIYSVDPTTGTLTVLHSFAPHNGTAYPEGRESIAPVVLGPDGKLWGTTSYGGNAQDLGTIFTWDPATSTYTLVHALAPYNGSTYPDGYYVYAGLVLGADGNLYGQTYSGGAHYNGVVFQITPGGTYTVKHDLNNSVGEGANGWATLSQGADGRLYGTSLGGGPTGNGVLFAVNTDGTGWTDLHGFYSTPAQPRGNVIRASDGNLYGVTEGGSGCGTIYRVNASDGSTQVLHVFFCNTGDGLYPQGGLVEAPDGNLYGTTYQGGANNYGTVYRIAKDGEYSIVHSMATYDPGCGCYPDGLYPYATLELASDGNLYGTNSGYGAHSNGTVFKVTTGGAFSVLYAFNNGAGDGSAPLEGVTQGPDGRLWGTTYSGALHGYGSLFAVDLAGNFTKYHDFDYTEDGYQSRARPAFDSSGRVYLSFLYGGWANVGAIGRYDPSSNTYQTVQHLYCDDGGGYPWGGLVQGSDGNMYGTTSQCGLKPSLGDQGTFFRVAHDGTFTPLFDFNTSIATQSGTLNQPRSTVFENTPGNFIGTTYYGGSSNRGGVYQITLFTTDVVSPNGGETVYDDAPYTITWKATGGTGGINHFDVAFSSNNGAAWSPVPGCSNVNGALRSCTWATPGPASKTALVRVTAFDNGGHSLADASNAVFTIKTGTSTAKITVTGPKAGGAMGIGTHQQITWTHDLGAAATFKIELSRDNGGTWSTLAGSVAAASATKGTFTWVATGPASTTALVRVSAVYEGVSATSGVFVIGAPSITVTPSVTWVDGQAATVKWKSNLGSLENVKIELSTDNGATFPITIAASTPSTGAFGVASVSPSWNTTQAKLRISWVANPSVSAVSAKAFAIQP